MAMGPRLEKLVPAHPKGVNISPPDAVSRHAENWDGFQQSIQRAGTWCPSLTASGQHITYSFMSSGGCGAMASRGSRAYRRRHLNLTEGSASCLPAINSKDGTFPAFP